MGLQLPRGALAWAVAVAAVLGVLALVAAGFNLGPFSEPRLSRGELIARGDEICRRAHDAFAELQRRAPGTASEAAELTGQLVDIASDELDQIKALRGPQLFDAEIARYVAARERGIDAMREGQRAAEQHDTDAYESAQAKVAASQRRRRRIARRIGFAECSRPLPG